MFEFKEITKDNVIAFKAKGKIEKADYEKLNPLMEKTEREGKAINLYIEIGDIEGITGGALLKDIATYFKHARYINKVAVVGEGNLHEDTWAKIADPFIKAEINYFPKKEQLLAEKWIQN